MKKLAASLFGNKHENNKYKVIQFLLHFDQIYEKRK